MNYGNSLASFKISDNHLYTVSLQAPKQLILNKRNTDEITLCHAIYDIDMVRFYVNHAM